VDLDQTGEKAGFVHGGVLVVEKKYTAETLELLERASNTIPLAHLLVGRVLLDEGEYAAPKRKLRRI
jgi:hypothetical protein